MNREHFDLFAEADMGEILQNPNKFGAPTFQQFCANREKYMGRSDEWFAAVDKGSTALARKVKKHIYKIKGYRVNTLEKLQQIALDMGLDPFKLIPKPEVIDVGGGWCNLEVTFVEPGEAPNNLEGRENGETIKPSS